MIEVDDEDKDLLLKYTWYPNTNGYYCTWIRINPKQRKQIFLHTLVGERIGLKGMLDHKDRNKTNCRRSNLREATCSQNKTNRGPDINNLSGFKGVSFRSKDNKWVAQIKKDKASKFIGAFDSLEEAARAYDRFAERYFGKFAYLNFPNE